MSGCLETATEAFLRKRFSLVKNMLQLVGNATIIQYVSCCHNTSGNPAAVMRTTW